MLKELMLSVGVSPKAATRRTNTAIRHGHRYERALIWGIKTFGTHAPTEVKYILSEKPFTNIAHYAYQHGYRK